MGMMGFCNVIIFRKHTCMPLILSYSALTQLIFSTIEVGASRIIILYLHSVYAHHVCSSCLF
jgi:hypothetical protein